MPHVTKDYFDNHLQELWDPTAIYNDPTATGSGLKIGDILIHRADKSHKWRDAYHASIMEDETTVTDSCPGKDGITSRGLMQFGDLAVVFRPKSKPNYGQMAGQEATRLRRLGVVGYSSGLLGNERALSPSLVSKELFNVSLGSSAFGAKARKRLTKYLSRQDMNPKNVICTELVILCYQFVIKNEADQHFIQLDGKYTHPMELESYMLNNYNSWGLVGKVSGQHQ